MSQKSDLAPMKIWTGEPLSVEVRQTLKRMQQADDVRHIAVMPDVHLAQDVCNGVAIATRELIYPQAVGGDIGCGMLAAAFDGDATELSEPARADRLLTELACRIPSNKHTVEAVPKTLPDDLSAMELSDPSLDRGKSRDGRYQLGTLGRGNHFVELQADADDRLWVMIHSGSRGMGQAITAHHLKRATRHGPGGLAALEAEPDAGRSYLRDLSWAIRYAEENRLAMLRAVAAAMIDVLGCRVDDSSLIHIHHNHVRRESHFAEMWWVHRKGAMPADDGLSGVIPGSMGTCSFHVTGRGCEAALRSCSHGAGRELPRRVAFQQIPRREFLRQMDGVAFDASRAELLRDEAPSAYKDIRAVMRAQRNLTRIVRELRPLLVYKGC
jgi:tRNA-splicing ligase RtcB